MLDGVSLDQLRTFIAAADEGSFSAAGRRLRRAQSVVSQTLANPEGQPGVKLFDHRAHVPVLTDQGRALLADARAVAGCVDLLKARAKSLVSRLGAYRHGLRISSAPAEPGMAHLVNQQMGKKQSMRWSAAGAHQLLQVRCAVLAGQLANFSREWFPGFRENPGSFERAM